MSTIIIKNSSSSGSQPATLNVGELAINTNDGKLFYGSAGGVQQLGTGGGGGTTNTGSLLTTASAAGNTITFTKGDTSTFDVTVSGGTGSPGGANKQLQFNGNGAFSGSSALTFNSGSNILTLTGSLNITGSTTQTGSLIITAGITGSLQGTASWANIAQTASSILGGQATYLPYFNTNTTLSTSSLYQSSSTSLIINATVNTTANPEALFVYQPDIKSINVISGKGNLDNYLQLNIQNNNRGPIASSDVVATADNGDENINYIDMGINSSAFNGSIGNANDAYLYSTGNHLHIGNATPDMLIQFFAGGTNTDLYRKFELDANNSHKMTGSLSISGSLNVRNNLTSSGLLTNGNNNILGNTTMSGSSTIIGTTTMTGSLLITGSTTQIGNNTLLGNTLLSGSITISGSFPVGSYSSSVNIYGDTSMTGYLKFNPQPTNIDPTVSASYIYNSGSTNDLYFAQNSNGYSNNIRLRWIEGNMFTGLLNGGLITTQSSTVYQVSSGSGIIVAMNAGLNSEPYPTVQYVNWPNVSASINSLTASYDQQFVAINSSGQIFAQGTPYNDGDFNTKITIGVVVHQNRSTINAVQTFPNVAYGWKQRSYDFVKAFGPLKIAGYTLQPSSSRGLLLDGGISFVDGRNYTVDPNNPSYITEATGITTSKLYRYRQSGSAGWVYDTNGGVGYTVIDPTQYSLNGVLTPVGSNDWSIQRVFYFPNSGTKAFYIYYGNATYANKDTAIAAINTEIFSEAPNTSANAILIGWMLVRNDANFTVAASYEFRQAGMFRGSGAGTGGSSGGGSSTLAGLSDVSITSPTNGQPLVYNSSTTKWNNNSSFTGSLQGSSSYALTASYAMNGGGGGGASFPYTGSATITGSLIVTGSTIATLGFTGSLQGTSSWAYSASQAISSSYATTASFLLGSVVSAQTASYATDFTISNTLAIQGTLTDYYLKSSTAPSVNNMFTRNTGSYTSAFGKYTTYSGSNARAGEFVTVWNGTTTTYYDNATTDIGGTSGIIFNSSIVAGQVQINTGVSTPSGWTIKMLITYM